MIPPVFGDFDDDGKTDLAVVRGLPGSASSGTYYWYIKGIMGGYMSVPFGADGAGGGNSPHYLAEADYDGDHKTDIAVYDSWNGIFYILQSSNNQVNLIRFGGRNINTATRDLPIRLANNSFTY